MAVTEAAAPLEIVLSDSERAIWPTGARAVWTFRIKAMYETMRGDVRETGIGEKIT